MTCCYLTLFSVILVVGITILKVYLKLTTGWCKSQTCLVGKTTIVTGANSGIGYYTALDFAKRGAKVILACRSQKRADEAKSRIIYESGNENVVVKIVDLSSLKSVRNFVKDVLNTEDRLDILVNNAGVLLNEKVTEEGLQLGMAANYFGPFLLTVLLIGLLKKTGNSRIVNVASTAAKRAHLDLQKLNDPGKAFSLYAHSKLCNILFTIELAKKLSGTTVTTYSLCPGLVVTNIFRSKNLFNNIFQTIGSKLFKNCLEGAQTQIHLSVTKGIENFSGQHFRECTKLVNNKSAQDPDDAKQLWKVTEDIVKLTNAERKF